MLTIRNLTKHFGGIRAVDGVDLSLGRGELVGLIGPNGSGKTTVFNLLTGIYRPDAGSMIFEGKHLSGIAPHRIFAEDYHSLDRAVLETLHHFHDGIPDLGCGLCQQGRARQRSHNRYRNMYNVHML